VTPQRFEARIVSARGGGAFVELPPEVVEALGDGGRIPVKASFDGVAYRGSVASMGGTKVLGMLKAIRAELGKGPGDRVVVTVERDLEERTIAVPDDLAGALEAAGMRAAFDALSFTHRREYVEWVEEAKRPETRSRRIEQTVARVGEN
jgi:hypothetical protein